MVEMKLYGLAVDEKAQSPVLILKDEAQDLALPIWVGPVEAMAISLAMNAVETPRPMTHDLILGAVAALDAELHAVEIVDLREGTFYAELVLKAPAGAADAAKRRVDCRPSDAIALALRAGVRILVAEKVLAEAGTRPLAAAKKDFTDLARDEWTEELEKLTPEDLKYKM